ncbi:hypothetical protein, variant [Phialophora macrospora]|uniref:Uncharacterized protein n=1 Tax=Phialophora macrospora TaxID=1851006 RepID=A0A0D2CYY8_9EURO|nr:hypothetical protein, variant [Phialophora macrospora]
MEDAGTSADVDPSGGMSSKRRQRDTFLPCLIRVHEIRCRRPNQETQPRSTSPNAPEPENSDKIKLKPDVAVVFLIFFFCFNCLLDRILSQPLSSSFLPPTMPHLARLEYAKQIQQTHTARHTFYQVPIGAGRPGYLIVVDRHGQHLAVIARRRQCQDQHQSRGAPAEASRPGLNPDTRKRTSDATPRQGQCRADPS